MAVGSEPDPDHAVGVPSTGDHPTRGQDLEEYQLRGGGVEQRNHRPRSVAWVLGLLLWIQGPGLIAQTTPRLLRGTLVDGQLLAPVEGAFVALEQESRGVLSGPDGYFALPVPISERYQLRVRQLGYRELVMTIGEEAFGRPLILQLDPNPIELEGLSVLAARFEDRRRGPFGAVDVFEGADLLRAPDGTAIDFVRRVMPFARPCDDQTENLCVQTQGRADPVQICIDERPVSEFIVELERVDPRSLHMVEVFRRGGQVRMYSRGYIQRMITSGNELSPLSFGCGIVGMPGGPGRDFAPPP